MRILLTGGSASGKSTYAMKLAKSFPGPWYRVDTMVPGTVGSELEAARQLLPKKLDGFIQIRRFAGVGALTFPQRGTVVLDCMCNLAANEMFDEQGRVRDIFDSILRDMAELEAKCGDLIVITNEIGSGYQSYEDETPAYIRMLGRLNCALAQRFDCVMEVVSGIPVVRKGILPFQKNASDTHGTDMILVIGGAASGKRAYVESLGYTREDMSMDPADDKPVLVGLQDLVAADPEHCRELLDALLKKQVVICSEVGSGVVPLDPREHDIRVQTGKLCLLLAQKARKVVRLVCGIPAVLKE